MKTIKIISDAFRVTAGLGPVALGLVLVVGVGQQAWAMQQKEEDSVYQWGRWAVLSPAAGGESYQAALTPDAANNARPSDADEFQPKAEGTGTPPVQPPVVVESCTAGTNCGFATYTRQEGSGSSNGPVLATFDLSNRQVTDPGSGDTGAGSGVTVTNFSVTDSGNAAFPDVGSVDIVGTFVDGEPDISGTQGASTFDAGQGAIVSDTGVSTLSHSNQDTAQVYDFNGVDAGYWSQLAKQQLEFILGDKAGTIESTVSNDSDGYFVHGQVATVEQMQAFSAGRVSATYNGFVLDFDSPAQLNFNFDNNTFNGNFGTANGFNGFAIDGAVNGVNFSASDAGKDVAGSFFNGGLNASGSVNNGTQQGVFSTDLTN